MSRRFLPYILYALTLVLALALKKSLKHTHNFTPPSPVGVGRTHKTIYLPNKVYFICFIPGHSNIPPGGGGQPNGR